MDNFVEDEVVNLKVSQAEHEEIEDGETIFQLELISSAYAFHYGEDSEKQVMGFACGDREDLPDAVKDSMSRFDGRQETPLQHIRNGGNFYCQVPVEQLIEMTAEIEGVFHRVRHNDSKSYKNKIIEDE